VERDPTGALYTPRQAKTAERRTMSKEEAEQYITVLDTREGIIAHLAIFCGMRPERFSPCSAVTSQPTSSPSP